VLVQAYEEETLLLQENLRAEGKRQVMFQAGLEVRRGTESPIIGV
jgi:hypothetical protein